MPLQSPTAPSHGDTVVLPTGRPPLLLLRDVAPDADGERGRALLVLASGVLILPGQRARVSARGPDVAFRIDHVAIGGRPADWLVHDLVIGDRSQFGERRHPAQIPGEVFSPAAASTAASDLDVALALAGPSADAPFDTAQPGAHLAVVVSYVGDDDGAPLVCVLDGTILDDATVEKTT